ncbi:MAG: HDIG domain-containing metalloprotein [Myxococcota bacterium]
MAASSDGLPYDRPPSRGEIARTWGRRAANTLLVLAAGGLLGLLIAPGGDEGWAALSDADVGKPARRDVKATRDFEHALSPAEIGRLRQARADAVQPVYDHAIDLGTEALGKLHAAFAAVRGAELSAPERLERFAEALGAPVEARHFEALSREGFSDQLRAALAFLVGSAFEDRVIEQRAELAAHGSGIRLRVVVADAGEGDGQPREEDLRDFHAIVGLAEARQALVRRAEVNYGRLPGELREAMVAVAQVQLRPNVRSNRAETEARRARARRTVAARPIVYVRGQVIVREGDLVRAEHPRIAAAMRGRMGVGAERWLRLAGMGLLVALVLGGLLGYAADQMRRFTLRPRDLLVLGALLVASVGACRAASIVALRFDLDPTSIVALALPVAAGPMLVKMVLGARATLLFALGAALLCALALGRDLTLAAYFLVAGVAGASGISRVRSRYSILRAGLLSGGVAALCALCLRLISADLASIPVAMALAALSGVVSGLLTTTLLPLLEALSGATTDITLLELCNLSHPLLRDLSLRAPGTYHHSMVVGNLAEAACDAIGANGLLARVAATFHDVGKGKNASYFAENFAPRDNPHGALEPSRSALIIRNHVKDTIDLLEAHRVPRVVIDTATQHHGTTLIEYFHHKAKTGAGAGEPIREEDFRYLGRRPQSPEAGVLMLADGVEAASRSLGEATEERLAVVVHRIISKKFTDGQLDECNLTLRDLNAIARAFLRVLGGIYHGRPAYPWQTSQTQPEEKGRENAADAAHPRPRATPAELDVTVEHAAEGRGHLGRLGLD